MDHDVMTPGKPAESDEKRTENQKGGPPVPDAERSRGRPRFGGRRPSRWMLSKVPADVRAEAQGRRRGEKSASARRVRPATLPTSGLVAVALPLPRRRSIYLVGHGIFVLSNGMFKVPENTARYGSIRSLAGRCGRGTLSTL